RKSSVARLASMATGEARGSILGRIGGRCVVTRARLVGALAVVVAGPLRAYSAADGSGLWDRVGFILTERLRGEFVDWFRPDPSVAPRGAERYDFLGSQLRAGVRVTFPHLELVLEGQDTRLANLPTDADGLGPGALYFQNTPETPQG